MGATVSYAFAYGLYFAILARAGAAHLLLVTLLIPPGAITFGSLFLGSTLSPMAWIGFVVILLGFDITDGCIFETMRHRISPPTYG